MCILFSIGFVASLFLKWKKRQVFVLSALVRNPRMNVYPGEELLCFLNNLAGHVDEEENGVLVFFSFFVVL